MPGLIHDTDEHQAIRESVAKIASRFGPEYFLERGRSGGDIDELWNELGAAGLLGVHLPEEYGGGGGGMADAVVVVEELAAHGMPMLIWDPRCARLGGPEARVAAGHRRRIAEGGVRAHRAGRRLQQPRGRHHGTS
jgi:alkylation response protein AidB-like acyl-CoA dehydrogenase